MKHPKTQCNILFLLGILELQKKLTYKTVQARHFEVNFSDNHNLDKFLFQNKFLFILETGIVSESIIYLLIILYFFYVLCRMDWEMWIGEYGITLNLELRDFAFNFHKSFHTSLFPSSPIIPRLIGLNCGRNLKFKKNLMDGGWVMYSYRNDISGSDFSHWEFALVVSAGRRHGYTTRNSLPRNSQTV